MKKIIIISMYHIILHTIGLLVVTTVVRCNGTTTTEEILRKYHAARLVPNKMRNAPLHLCHVQFKKFNLTMGRVVYRRDIFEEPKVIWDSDANSLYTLFVGGSGLKSRAPTDSDSDSSSDIALFPRQWQQWVIINIPGNNVSAGEEIFRYVPPLLPDDVDGGDYYAYWIFKQNGPINVTKPKDKKGYLTEELTPVQNFSDSYKLGNPLFGNFLRIEWHFVSTPFDKAVRIPTGFLRN